MNFRRKINLTITAMLAVSCNACYKDYNTDSLLKKEYEVVMCVLAPDSAQNFTRDYPVEVFVGKMIPTDIHNQFLVQGQEDLVLRRLMFGIRQWYLNYYEYDSTSQVSIHNGSQNVQLTYVGFGIYRDVNHELNIKAQQTDSLYVKKKDGRLFTAQTIIPGNITIDSIDHKPASLDTLFVVPNSINRGNVYLYKISSITEPFYCVYLNQASNFDFIVNVYAYKDELNSTLGKAVVFSDQKTQLPISTIQVNDEFRSVNQGFGLFNEPYDFSLSDRFLHVYNDSLHSLSIENRSNIQGKNVVGAFGGYNATRKSYVVTAVNSIGKSNSKH